MKKIILSTILLSILTGCGVGEKICPRKLAPMGCNALVGEEKADADKLEETKQILLDHLTSIQYTIYNLQWADQALIADLSAVLQNIVDEVEQNNIDVLNQISLLSSAVNLLGQNLAQVDSICGETILKLGDSFIRVMDHELVELETGKVYKVQSCRFKVENNDLVEVQ